jgi:hypothetical protein
MSTNKYPVSDWVRPNQSPMKRYLSFVFPYGNGNMTPVMCENNAFWCSYVYCKSIINLPEPGNSVSIISRLRSGRPGFDSRQDRNFFLFA